MNPLLGGSNGASCIKPHLGCPSGLTLVDGFCEVSADVSCPLGTMFNSGTGKCSVLPFSDIPTGQNVLVQTPTGSSGINSISLEFDEVTTQGTLMIDLTDSGPPPPQGFSLQGFGTTTTYFDITKKEEIRIR